VSCRYNTLKPYSLEYSGYAKGFLGEFKKYIEKPDVKGILLLPPGSGL